MAVRLKEILTPSFRDLGRELGLQVEVFEDRLVIIAPMWQKALSVESLFCRAVVSAGYLTEEQMLRAARRYRLGCTRRGGVIFWQIGADGDIHDGKVMYYCPDCHRDKLRHPTWVSTMLARRYRWADADRMTTRHCLFGAHLLADYPTPNPSPKRGGELLPPAKSTDTLFPPIGGELLPPAHSAGVPLPSKGRELPPAHSAGVPLPSKGRGQGWGAVAVVESEKSAVILSELFPQRIWLATGGLGNVQADKFRPLRGRQVVLFPDTDPDGTTFRHWYEAAQIVMQQPFWEGSPPIQVSALLEQHATPAQKAAKIDLVDLIFEK